MRLVVPLVLPAHELWFTAPCQAIVIVENTLKFIVTKEAGEELGLMGAGFLEREVMDIPGHIHKGLDAQFHGLDITHIQQPIAVGPCIVGFLQLLVHQYGRRCVLPEIVVWGS